MESGSAVVGREERKKYHVYVEEYVLSYLRRESDSLELSEIYFYGSRQEDGRKLYVYGAGRAKGIAAFAEYELLSELVCRLTQAGPVFLVREPDGECRPSGFQIFYDNNEAMQNYLLEWTGSTGKARAIKKDGGQEKLPAPTVFPEEEKKRTSHGAMSVQLCLILVVLVAIVITSTDSYDKMEELNRSAKEVFFAIENQEAGQENGQKDDLKDTVTDETGQQEKRKEVLVERDTGADDISVEDAVRAENAARAEKADQAIEDSGDGSQTDASTAQEGEDSSAGSDASAKSDDQAAGSGASVKSGDTVVSSDTSAQGEDAAASDTSAQTEDSSEEALSRNITRYYEVERGDTLYTISQKIYGDTSRVEKICEVNAISDPDKISEGQKIILP